MRLFLPPKLLISLGGPVKLPKPRQQLVARNTLVQKIRLLREQGRLGWFADCLTSQAAYRKGTKQLADEKIKRGVFLAQTAATEADQTLSVEDREILAQTKKDGLSLYDTIINTYKTLSKMNKQVRDLACTPGL